MYCDLIHPLLTVRRLNVVSYDDRTTPPPSVEPLPAELSMCLSLTQFKSRLKTHLFQLAFPQDWIAFMHVLFLYILPSLASVLSGLS